MSKFAHDLQPNFVKVHADIYNDAVKKITKLENLVRELVKIVEFYADKDTYNFHEDDYYFNALPEADCELFSESGVNTFGGKRARQARELEGYKEYM